MRSTVSLLLLMTVFGVMNPLQAQNYQVGPSDVLKISVVDLEDMTGEYRIDTQGNLNLPHLGMVEVKNRDVNQVRGLVAEKLQSIMNNPQVFVELIEINWRPINVIGAVKTPGKLTEVFQNITLVDAITRAGGLQENAGDTILIMRTSSSGFSETLKVSYRELLIEGQAHLNIPLLAGDTINIPVERPLVISVLGEVNKPGEYTFDSTSKVTLLRVIAAAGGFTDFAKRNRVAVRRDGKEERVDVRAIVEDGAADFDMQNGDIVSIP